MPSPIYKLGETCEHGALRRQCEICHREADIAELRAKLAEMQWQPIETAPKDGTNIMVTCPRLGVCCPAHWDNDQYAKKPRPYWTHWGERIWGITWVRNDQPTHWMPLPAAPIDAEMKK